MVLVPKTQFKAWNIPELVSSPSLFKKLNNLNIRQENASQCNQSNLNIWTLYNKTMKGLKKDHVLPFS